MPKRAALYIRVSSDEQARHGLSLGEQRADLTKYAQEHGYVIVDVYADEGFTARKAIARRHQLQRLLNDVRAGLIDIIVMKCLDRWFRNIADYYKVQEILDQYGVLWECTQEKYNTTTSQGRLLLNVKLSVAQNESDQTSERIKYIFDGKKARKEVVSGNLPLGYTVENKHIVPGNEAPIVRYIFDSIGQGKSIRSISAGIAEQYGKKIRYKRIHDALRNRSYLGEFYGIPDYAPAIIPYDVFQRTQEIISTKKRKDAPTGRIYLFSGLLRCPDCGRALSGNRGRPDCHGEFTSYQYRCSARLKDRFVDACQFHRSIFESKIEKYLLDNLYRMVSEHIYFIELQSSQSSGPDPKAEMDALQLKLLRLKDLYIDGLIDKDVYRKDFDKLNRRIADLSLKIEKAGKIPSSLQRIVDGSDFLETYQTLTRERKRAFWQSIISRITFEDLPENRGTGKTIHFHVEFL